MQYLLLIYGDEAKLQSASPDIAGQRMAAFKSYTEALSKDGALVTGRRLHPAASGSTVRTTSGKTHTLNGPYAETKEQLGGFFLIEAPDLDAALAWAARCPGASYGTMEVRPVWSM